MTHETSDASNPIPLNHNNSSISSGIEIDWEQLIDNSNSGDFTPNPLKLEPIVPLQDRIQIRSQDVMPSIREGIKFDEHHLGRIIDVLGFGKTLPGGGYQSYGDRHEQERIKKGLDEAAFFGIGEIGNHSAVVFGMDYDFLTGTLSTDGGARFQKAADLAVQRDLPLIALYSSAGARQQENGRALMQLRRMIHASNKLDEKRSTPHIGVLIGQVWGGISAGSAPVSDLLLAYRGTDYGFSGPRIIQSYTGEAVPPVEQSVEAHSKTRLVDVLVNDTGELLNFIDNFLTLTDADHNNLTSKDLSKKKRAIDQQIFPEIPDDPQELFDRYMELRGGTSRPDAEFLISHSFDQALQLFNSHDDGEVTRNPAIIAAVARIGPQPFLVIGNQPSYYQSGEELRKIPSSPEPKDYLYMRRMMALGEKLGLPLVLLTDTLGAKPTLEAEKQGQAREIAEAISAVDKYPHPVISVISGGLGSGGGLATSIGDVTLMLDKAMLFVAEPQAAASILYSTSNPSTSEVMQTIKTMGATANDQLRLGIVDSIVPEGTKNETALNLRELIIRSYLQVQDLSPRRLSGRRDKRVRSLGEPLRSSIVKRLHHPRSDTPSIEAK